VKGGAAVKSTLLAGGAVLLLAACGSSSSPGAGSSTLFGRVLSAPSCPVEQLGRPCPPRPVEGALVEAVQDGAVVASTHTAGRGRFQLRLDPGRYVIRATNVGAYASVAERPLVIRTGAPEQLIQLVVDSGIR
jgi:hypothetical protein